jgi:glucosamine--fructose-6-phosphate aminotransferase (isomerizing)
MSNTESQPAAPAPGSVMRSEILEQPAVLARLLSGAAPVVEEVARSVPGCDLAVLAARGSSDNASTYGKYLLESFAGLPTALAAPSLFTLYELPPRLGRALTIGVSQSGQAADVAGVLAEARRQGAPTLAITNTADSLLTRTAERVLLLEAGVEKALAATKTVTAQCLAYALLAQRAALPERRAALDDCGLHPRALEALPGDVAAALALDGEIDARALAWAGASRVIVIGRGFAYGAAQETALKLKETCYINAEPYSAADFQHGPLALIEPGYAVLALLNHDRTLDTTLALAEQVRQRGADVLAVATAGAAARLPAGLPALVVPSASAALSPISFVAVGQLLALRLSLRRGHNPDVSRGLNKVTVTL